MFVPSLPHRDGIYLEEGFGLGAGVGIKAVGDLVEVVDGVGLDTHNLSAQGQILQDGSLIRGIGELHSLVQLVEQSDIDAAEAPVEGECLVSGGHVHQVAGLGLVVQVIHSDNKPRALINLKLPLSARQDAVVHQASVPCRRTQEAVQSRRGWLPCGFTSCPSTPTAVPEGEGDGLWPAYPVCTTLNLCGSDFPKRNTEDAVKVKDGKARHALLTPLGSGLEMRGMPGEDSAPGVLKLRFQVPPLGIWTRRRWGN